METSWTSTTTYIVSILSLLLLEVELMETNSANSVFTSCGNIASIIGSGINGNGF